MFAASLYWKDQKITENNVRLMKRALTKDLLDPETTRMRSVRFYAISDTEESDKIDWQLLWRSWPDEILSRNLYNQKFFALCGELNTKNEFGAFIGYRPFYVMNLNPKELNAFIDNESGSIVGSIAKTQCTNLDSISDKFRIHYVSDNE